MLDNIAFELMASREITKDTSKLEKILALASVIFILSIELIVLIIISIVELIVLGSCRLAKLAGL